MRSHNLFLLVYSVWSCVASSGAQTNATCAPAATCGQVPDPTLNFLQCVGLPSTDTGRDHIYRLKQILEATMDIYTFMKSSMKGVPILSLQGELHLNPTVDPYQNEALVQMWMEVKLKPLLHSITKHFLSCLSTKNFSCSTYQTMVTELSHHFSEMNPVRQKWIYMFFMYPFLSRDRIDGCVGGNETSEDWLIKNFGAFKAMARLQDFSTLNMAFSGLEVLHLLSPVQKAELLMRPEVASLDNATLTFIFHNLLTGGSKPNPTGWPVGTQNWTTPLYPSTHYPPPTPDPYLPSSPHSGFSVREVVNGFMTAFKPINSFVHDFVTLTRDRDVSEIKSTVFTQFLLNWTLSELADMYRPMNASVVPQVPTFDVTNVEDWYLQVVIPLLKKFLPNAEAVMHENITLAFQQVFYLEHGMNPNEENETYVIQDVCSVTLDKAPCGLTDAVANVANVLHCAARTDLPMTEHTVIRLVHELTARLNSLVKELAKANFSEVASEFRQIFTGEEPPTLPQEHLKDPGFIALWFKVKLLPLLPAVPINILSCLSTKNFTCPVFYTIVGALGHHMSVMSGDPMYSHNIYKYFIYQHLWNRNWSDPQCVSSANDSAAWLQNNFGFFFRFASITDFYRLGPMFSGLGVLHLLSPKQTAELLLLPLPTPPEKDVVIDRVFDYLLEAPEDRRLSEVLSSLIQLAREVDPPCSIYTHIFERLYNAVSSLSPHLESLLWADINELINITPDACRPDNVTCSVTGYNASRICGGIDSFALQSYLNTSMDVPCNFTLEMYACAQKEFTAHQLASLLKCNLPGNSSNSRMIWKMLLTKSSKTLDLALDILADMPMSTVVPSATEVLDVVRELRLSLLTDEQLRNQSVITRWFSSRLSRLLPAASAQFLICLGFRNLSCHSYQQILQVFSNHFDKMTSKQQEVVLKDFIMPFLTHSDPSCVSINNSTDWLLKNLGVFSQFLTVKKMFELNPHFNPVEVLQLLTPTQNAELLVLNHVTLQDKDAIINMVFDSLLQSANTIKFTQFLSKLVMFLQMGSLSCSSYKTLFGRLDLALDTAPLDVAREIIYTKTALSIHIPPGCVIYGGQCNVTITNETDICSGVNSTTVQLLLHSNQMSRDFCDYSVEEFACASLSALKAEELVGLLTCNRTWDSISSKSVWKLLLSKASNVLDPALDLLANKTLDPRNPAWTMILDSIREVRLDVFSSISFNNPDFIKLWFEQRLHPFLPFVSSNFLSCLTAKGLNCSAYQYIVQIFSSLKEKMSDGRQMSVYNDFIQVYLTGINITDPGCRSHFNNSGEWLQKNLGAFSALVSFHDMQLLHLSFSVMEALPYLTVRQLAELSSTPGQLRTADQVNLVMRHVQIQQLSSFFDFFSSAIMLNQNSLNPAVIPAMLQIIFDNANLSDPSVSDSVVWQWLHKRIRPLLFNLSPDHVTPFFAILAGRNCSIQVQGVQDLNSTISSLSETTQTVIHDHIIQMLKGPKPLQCYGDNYNHSFYTFLENSFMGFKFPNLTSFLSLMPDNRRHQLMNSIPPSHLGNFLRRPNVVDNNAELCGIFSNYMETPMFLETESLPAVVRRPTLPCVWPMALRSSKRSEVNRWFDQSLRNYLVFLTKSLISPKMTYNSSCVAFQKLVSVLGVYNYTAVDFMRPDIYDTIRTYLKSANIPRCYNSSDPELNSTAWFAEYIGSFLQFLSLEDFQAFGSEQFIQVFTVNLVNIALFNQITLPLNLSNYYTQLVYQQDSNFNPIHLPLVYRCMAPGPAFTQLTPQETIVVLYNLSNVCTDLGPQVSAALASNLGDSVDANAIAALGNKCTGLSTGQLMMINPEQLLKAVSTLRAVDGWNQGQANAIIQILLSSGMMTINSSTLLTLGSLVMGIPSRMYSSISGTELLTASKNPSFVRHILTAPQIVQQTFVTQIVALNSNSDMIAENIPDELAVEIPRSLLLNFTNSSDIFKKLNKKNWKRQQAELFFSQIAAESATTTLGSANNLSSSVLQGFTCLSVSTMTKSHVKKLIQASRRKGRNKIPLVETQLTCMYNYIRKESDVASFDLYPPDLLLYYDYSLVPQNVCRAYFTQLADADFSVFSSSLSYKRSALFTNAKSCLGITSLSLSQDTVAVLGNMCCTLNVSYIMNSDPSILEKLKNCPDLTSDQVAAVEARLLSGKTQYGAPSTWNEKTLKDLAILPLYLTSTFYENFDKKTKQIFMDYFLKVLQENDVSKQKTKMFREEIKNSMKKMTKRSIAKDCTLGNITQVTISKTTFPFDYDDVNQFDICLSPQTVKDNLAAITDKLVQEEYLSIILSKLREAYRAHSTIAESQVKLLGPASRMATTADINMWNISEIDTLSALMDSSNGEWKQSLAEAIITKYLSVNGNKLGSAELNSLRGPNLCTLDISILSNISAQSIRDADALEILNCTTEKKKVLYTIAAQAFTSIARSAVVAPSNYQLLKSYLPGAPLSFIQRLSTSNINMDMSTFTNLDENIVLSLTVSEVQGLLGSNLNELKSYENQTLVKSWIRLQSQSQLDTLEIGLTGGTTSPTTTVSATTQSETSVTVKPNAVTSTAVTTTTTTTTVGKTTGSHGTRICADSSLLALLLIFITSQYMFISVATWPTIA